MTILSKAKNNPISSQNEAKIAQKMEKEIESIEAVAIHSAVNSRRSAVNNNENDMGASQAITSPANIGDHKNSECSFCQRRDTNVTADRIEEQMGMFGEQLKEADLVRVAFGKGWFEREREEREKDQ